MELLRKLVRNPHNLILPKHCQHRHKAFTHDYDFECLACGQRFDTE